MTQPQHVAATPRVAPWAAKAVPTGRLPAWWRGLTRAEVRALVIWSRMCAEDE